MDETEEQLPKKKSNKGLLIAAIVCIVLAIVIFMVYEFAPLQKAGLARFASYFFFISVAVYLVGIALLVAYVIKRIKSGAKSGKGGLLIPLLALGCDLLAVFLFIIGMYMWIDLIDEVPIMLTILLLPVAGILLAIYSLSQGRAKIGKAGFAVSIIAVVIPAICITLVILYLSFLALVLAFM